MIILMGLAGSGKSTQGKMLAEVTGKVWLSAGQVLRDANDPELKAVMEQGKLVDDMLTVKLMANKMAEVVRGGRDAILDGFPRDVEQAEWIAENIAEVMRTVVIIEVPKEELYQRLALRGRADDLDKNAIEERFRIVEQNIYAVCEILAGKGVKIVKIDGTGTPEEVFERLKTAVAEEGMAELGTGAITEVEKVTETEITKGVGVATEVKMVTEAGNE